MNAPISLRPHPTLFAVAAVLLAALSIGCSGGEQDRPDGMEWSAGGSSSDIDLGSEGHTSTCTSGVVGTCKVTVKQANGIVSCYEGVKYCVDEKWSRCMDVDETPLL